MTSSLVERPTILLQRSGHGEPDWQRRPAKVARATVYYLYYDGHGNLAAEANSGGTITGNHTYDSFGAPTDPPPTNTTVHRFTGRWDKQYDTTTGLVLMGARPYDPTTGRFLSVDPIPGGSLNGYDYAGQDPINNYDLAGTTVEDDETSGFVAAYKPAPDESEARGNARARYVGQEGPESENRPANGVKRIYFSDKYEIRRGEDAFHRISKADIARAEVNGQIEVDKTGYVQFRLQGEFRGKTGWFSVGGYYSGDSFVVEHGLFRTR